MIKQSCQQILNNRMMVEDALPLGGLNSQRRPGDRFLLGRQKTIEAIEENHQNIKGQHHGLTLFDPHKNIGDIRDMGNYDEQRIEDYIRTLGNEESFHKPPDLCTEWEIYKRDVATLMKGIQKYKSPKEAKIFEFRADTPYFERRSANSSRESNPPTHFILDDPTCLQSVYS
eukprot:TRINITY_DN786_c0_g1_i12.p2 TRINITY_DN786_c0_g1~~TRINITY_DN786_c0_g1_i12.p2  ORF type:complete len:172 (+),score=25.11 TRINITY_DN786_c0_g1_i12:744-1259(+)